MEYNQNNYYNNNNGGYAQPQYPGQTYVPNIPSQPSFNSSLTPDEISRISNKKPSKIDITISEEDNLRSMCNHKSNGREMVQQINDGTGEVWCPICNERWNPNKASKEELELAVSVLNSAMQNAKWIGDLSTMLIRDFCPINPLMKKIPDIYEYAMTQFNKYIGTNAYNDANTASIYSQFNDLMGYGAPNMYAGPTYNTPAYNNNTQYADPYAQQQQQMFMAQQQQMQANQMNPNAGYMNPMQAGQMNNGSMMMPNNTQFTDQTNRMMGGTMYQNPQNQNQGQQQQVNKPETNANAGYTPNYAPAETVNKTDNTGMVKTDATVKVQ